MLGNDKISQNMVKSKTKREIRIELRRMKKSIRQEKKLVSEKLKEKTKCLDIFETKIKSITSFVEKLKILY